jgi:imidazolonepropionase-like amidohydrolase
MERRRPPAAPRLPPHAALLLCLTLALLYGCGRPNDPSAAASATHGVRWEGGLWFDGERFVPRTVFTVDGYFADAAPTRVDEVVDLHGAFVVPPFADAHHHGIDSADGLDAKIRTFLRHGIFYVKNPNVIPDLLTPEVRGAINRPESIDVVFSNGGLTRTGGHPAGLHAMLAAKGVFKGLRPEDMENRAYFFIDDEAMLDAKWPRIRAGKPDFIKTFLGVNEREDTPPPMRGLTKEVLAAVVRRAHADHLRVTTHVMSVGDFRAAVEGGVDEITHLPWFMRKLCAATPEVCLLDDDDARRAAARGVIVVVAPFAWRSYLATPPPEVLQGIERTQDANFRKLAEHGVSLGIGSDGISGETPMATALADARAIDAHHLVDRARLLRMWTDTTARTIFPDRKIGRLVEGYEASFLALAGDPIADFANVERIRVRVKQGRRIDLPDGP